MRSSRVILALPILLGACGMFSRAPTTPDSPEQAECRVVARNSDEVRQVMRTLSPGNNERILQEDAANARERAFRSCLRERRLPGAGGVEGVPR